MAPRPGKTLDQKRDDAQALYVEILHFFHVHHRVPTQRELAAMMGISRYEVSRRVARLQGQGRIFDGTTKPVELVEELRRG